MDRVHGAPFEALSPRHTSERVTRPLRAETAKRGLNANRWFTVTYVANIYKYYIAYKLLTEAEAEKRQAREALKKGKSP